MGFGALTTGLATIPTRATLPFGTAKLPPGNEGLPPGAADLPAGTADPLAGAADIPVGNTEPLPGTRDPPAVDVGPPPDTVDVGPPFNTAEAPPDPDEPPPDTVGPAPGNVDVEPPPDTAIVELPPDTAGAPPDSVGVGPPPDIAGTLSPPEPADFLAAVPGRTGNVGLCFPSGAGIAATLPAPVTTVVVEVLETRFLTAVTVEALGATLFVTMVLTGLVTTIPSAAATAADSTLWFSFTGVDVCMELKSKEESDTDSISRLNDDDNSSSDPSASRRLTLKQDKLIKNYHFSPLHAILEELLGRF